MTTYKSSAVKNKDFSDATVPYGTVIAVKGTYTIPTGDLTADDVVQMVSVPKGAIILDVVAASSDTTTSLVIDVGDGTTADKFIDGITASSAFVSSLSADGDPDNDGVGYQYTAADTIDMTFLAAAADATNVYTLIVTYRMA